jgi:hypothetical protein
LSSEPSHTSSILDTMDSGSTGHVGSSSPVRVIHQPSNSFQLTTPCESASIMAKSASGSNGGSSTTSGQRRLRRSSTWMTSALSRKPDLSLSAMSNSVRAKRRVSRSWEPRAARSQWCTMAKSSIPSFCSPSFVSRVLKALLRWALVSFSPILLHSASNPSRSIMLTRPVESFVLLPASSIISMTLARRLRLPGATPLPGERVPSSAAATGTVSSSSSAGFAAIIAPGSVSCGSGSGAGSAIRPDPSKTERRPPVRCTGSWERTYLMRLAPMPHTPNCANCARARLAARELSPG